MVEVALTVGRGGGQRDGCCCWAVAQALRGVGFKVEEQPRRAVIPSADGLGQWCARLAALRSLLVVDVDAAFVEMLVDGLRGAAPDDRAQRVRPARRGDGVGRKRRQAWDGLPEHLSAKQLFLR
eukprot:scaffold59947_cov59-Phaeocystis_antarctica.AAC.2